MTIEKHAPSYDPTPEWLESQAKHAANTGLYTSERNQERVLQVVDEIRSFDYDRFATPRAMAKRWGVGLPYARLLCAEAVRVVREELEDESYAKATVLEALHQVISTNVRKPGVGHQGLVVRAAKVYSEITGIRAPLELKLSRGQDDLPNDPVELARLADELSKRVLGAGVELEGTVDAPNAESADPVREDGPALEGTE